MESFMRKIRIIFVIVCSVVILMLLKKGVAEKNEQQFSNIEVTYIDNVPFAEDITQMSMVELMPCVLVNGEVYLYKNEEWVQLAREEPLIRVFSGEQFCGLTETGKIDVEIIAEVPENTPLTVAGINYNAAQILELTKERKIEDISSSIFDETLVVLFADGTVEMYVSGKRYTMKEPLNVVKVEGTFLLTNTGDVYKADYSEKSETISLKKVSMDIITDISASETAARCAGIKKDGTIEVWSDLTQEFVVDFQNVEKVCMGFNYCVAIREDGVAQFASYDKDIEKEVNTFLESIKQKVLYVTNGYNRIIMILEDYSLCLIDI